MQPQPPTISLVTPLVMGVVNQLLHLPFKSAGALEAQGWSAQGLGMLRCYLSKAMRLHVWDRALRVPGVSAIHDHPWSFTSHLLTGSLINVVYERCEAEDPAALPFRNATIQCGGGAHALAEPVTAFLRVKSSTCYSAGEAYHSSSDEIHESLPEDGTITIIDRTFDKANVDHASVWWAGTGPWVSAEPRPATPKEVLETLHKACARLDNLLAVAAR